MAKTKKQTLPGTDIQLTKRGGRVTGAKDTKTQGKYEPSEFDAVKRTKEHKEMMGALGRRKV